LIFHLITPLFLFIHKHFVHLLNSLVQCFFILPFAKKSVKLFPEPARDTVLNTLSPFIAAVAAERLWLCLAGFKLFTAIFTHDLYSAPD